MKPIPLGAFELHSPIRRGGMAEVWRGVHKGQNVPVAIKIMTGKRARHPQYLRAFRNEVQAVAALDHPGIILIFDHGEVSAEAEELSGRRFVAGSPYLVMELSSSGSLDQARPRLPWPELKALLIALLDALAHAHARGVIHRDLKPGNVLMGSDGDIRQGIKITDFGLAQGIHEQDREGTRESMAGTPRYMPPEMFEGRWRTYGPWTDLYALGCMTYELIDRKPLFDGSTSEILRRQHLYTPPPSLMRTRHLPGGFQEWLHRLLCKKPGDRFLRAADAAWALLSLGDPEAPDPSLPGAFTHIRSAHTEVFSTMSGFTSPATFMFPEPTLMAQTMLHAQEGINEAATYILPEKGIQAASTYLFPAVKSVAGASTFLFPKEYDPLSHAAAQIQSRRPSRPPTGKQDTQNIEPMPCIRPPIPASWHRTTIPAPPMSLVGAGLSLYGLRTVRFVGRVGARDKVWKALNNVQTTGKAHLALIHGEAGIGKSRLARWVCERAHELGAATFLKAVHSPIPGPANGLSGMLARHLRCLGLPRHEVRHLVRAQLRSQNVTTDHEWDALTQLITSGQGQSTGARAKVVRFNNPTERYATIHRLLERESERRAVIVWFDDVQWGSDALWFAQYVLKHQALHARPILLLLTAENKALSGRTMESHVLEQVMALPNTQSIELGPLHPDSQAKLVHGLLGLESELAQRVQDNTAGNPLYAVQLVGSWVERGLLDVGEGGFVLKPGAEAVAPEDMESLWASKISRLTEHNIDQEEAQKALEIAAVLGQNVDANEWREACAQSKIAMTIDMFHVLVSSGLFEPSHGFWAFTHNLAREVLIQAARDEHRWHSHNEACARMLRLCYPNNRGKIADRLARHLIEADQHKSALPALLEGAREHIEGSEYRQALEQVDLYDKALEQLQIPEEDPGYGRGWLLKVRVHRLTGHFDEAFTWAEKAVGNAWKFSGWEDLLPSLLTELGHVAVLRGDLDLAENIYTEALQEHQKTQDKHGVADCLRGQGQVAFRRGNLSAATQLLRQSLIAYEQLQDKAGIAQCLRSLWNVIQQRGDTKLADALIQQALKLHQALGNQLGVADCLAGQGQIAMARGQLARASDLYQRAMALFEELGSQTGAAQCLDGLAEVAMAQGDFEAAEAWCRRALTLQEASGAGDAILSQINLGLAMIGAQRHDEARKHLTSVLEVTRTEGRRALLACIHAHLVICASLEHHWSAWDHHLQQTRNLLTETQVVDPRIAQALQRAGAMTLEASDPKRALDAYEISLDQWKRLRKSAQTTEVKHILQKIRRSP